jgi:hypothetical protein
LDFIAADIDHSLLWRDRVSHSIVEAEIDNPSATPRRATRAGQKGLRKTRWL